MTNQLFFCMNYTIKANASGTREITIDERHLLTIDRYALFQNLIDSTGVIDESVVEKLRYNVRSMLASDIDHPKDLIDLCADILYHDKFKAFALHQTILLFVEWKNKQKDADQEV